MANARTTKTAEGGPYKRQSPVFRAEKSGFGGALEKELSRVVVSEIRESDDDAIQVFDPGHPDADADGYVYYPDINIMEEMVDLMNTSRSYEANSNVIDVTQQMARGAIDIGRG
jgi:flagellar basal-body rod protein FlgC